MLMGKLGKTVLFLFMIAAGICLTACQAEKEAPAPKAVRPVKTVAIEESALTHYRSYPGQIQPTREVDLAFRVSGNLMELPVFEGQEIERNDTVARLDPRDFETKLAEVDSSLAEAEAMLASMKSARPEDIRALEEDVKAAEADLNAKKNDYDRYSRLFKSGATSKARLDLSQRNLEVAQARLNAARENLEKGVKGARPEDVKAQEARIDRLTANKRQTQDALEDTHLKAPFTGIVAKKYVNNFQEVQAKQAIISLQDLSTLDIVINVPESFIVTATKTKDYKAWAVFDAIPDRRFDLTYKEIAAQPDPQTKTYALTLKMSPPKKFNILAGMTAQVTLAWSGQGEASREAFQIPVQAVLADAKDQAYVWIVDPDKLTVHRRDVQVGEMTGDRILVLKGLKPGDKVVTAGVNYLEEAQKVRLMDQAEKKK